MPFPNEHAARLADPEKFTRFRRSNDKFGEGIDAIFGIRKENNEEKTELQAIRFDKKKFTEEEAKKWLANHDHHPILFEPAEGPVRESGELIREAGLKPRQDGSCPEGYPVKRRDPVTGAAMCLRRMTESDLLIGEGEINKKVRAFIEALKAPVHLYEINGGPFGDEPVTEQTVPSGLHEHPHEPNGIHDHLGTKPQTGSHGHERSPVSGGHSHAEGNPIDGFHLGDETDSGVHIHILANRETIPALWEWFQQIVAAHFGAHPWIENHHRTLIRERHSDGSFSAMRETTQGDWEAHGLWSTHSAGANAAVHDALFLNPESRFLELTYEMQDGSVREATTSDFLEEEKWFDEHLPFPSEEVMAAIGPVVQPEE